MPAPTGVGEGEGDCEAPGAPLGVPDGAVVTSAFAPAFGLRSSRGASGAVEESGLGVGVGDGDGEGVGVAAATCAAFFLPLVFGEGEGDGVEGGTLKRSRHEYPSIVDGHLNPVWASLIA